MKLSSEFKNDFNESGINLILFLFNLNSINEPRFFIDSGIFWMLLRLKFKTLREVNEPKESGISLILL